MKTHIPLMTSTVSSRLLLCVVESALTHLIHIIVSRRILDFLQCSSARISKATLPALLKARGTSCLSFGQWDGSGSGFQGSPFHLPLLPSCCQKDSFDDWSPSSHPGTKATLRIEWWHRKERESVGSGDHDPPDQPGTSYLQTSFRGEKNKPLQI